MYIFTIYTIYIYNPLYHIHVIFQNTSEDKNSSEDKTHSKTKLVRRQNVLTNTMLKPRTIITPHIVQIKSHSQH